MVGNPLTVNSVATEENRVQSTLATRMLVL